MNTDTAELTIMSWNVCWLVDMKSHKVLEKRARVEAALAKGQIVCLQETHWADEDAKLWLLGLLAGRAYHSSLNKREPTDADDSTSGRTGKLGGVVTILPPGFSFTPDGCCELVPGHAILTQIEDPQGTTHSIVNCYLRPGRTTETWDNLLGALPEGVLGGPNTVFIGDFNTELTNYGNPSTSSQPEGPQLEEAGVILFPEGPTHSGAGKHRTTDGMVATGENSAQWRIWTQWTVLSDHAMVFARRSSRHDIPTHIACTPARFWSLPQEARAELREDFEHIAQSLQVPKAQRSNMPAADNPVPGPGTYDPLDPLLELTRGEDRCEMSEEDPQAPVQGEDAVWNLLLANWGYAFIDGAFQAWWRRWRRRTQPKDPCLAELREIASRRGKQGAARTKVSEELRCWLSSIAGPEALTAQEAKSWLNVWLQLQRANGEAQGEGRAMPDAPLAAAFSTSEASLTSSWNQRKSDVAP